MDPDSRRRSRHSGTLAPRRPSRFNPPWPPRTASHRPGALMSGTLEVVTAGPVARVWLNRPEQHNALAAELGAELTATMQTLGHDRSVRVVVLGGRGPSFCAGADIGLMKASAHATFEQNLAEAERLGGMFATIADLPKPVIARLHGHVLGGGVGLACACDIAVAAEDARFALSEVRLGRRGASVPECRRRRGEAVARGRATSEEARWRRIHRTRACRAGSGSWPRTPCATGSRGV
ncbi:MAG: hypothetical protein E6K81_09930 [Candidatus Eisenbacteria bacterium]|uniref:Enoyl-CoA hydratase/isomerase family protein n=1 Tax=Eiseniibacteriota bacterium TaxID=2212470 RepID=A0A538U6F5_UNCEI|nr:MAG: hypothetical protein E6K81_09930 [Candidatus Eisenbacteria bacterium]